MLMQSRVMPRSSSAIAPARGKPFTSLCSATAGLQLLPEVFGNPVQHRPPLRRVEERRLVARQRRDVELAAAERLQELLPPLRRGRLPPVVHREQRLARPVEPPLRRLRHRRQHAVERDVEVAALQLAAHARHVGEADIGVREVDDVDAMNG